MLSCAKRHVGVAVTRLTVFGRKALRVELFRLRPKVGMTMEAVKSYFGAPTEVTGPTGNPAIYQFKYADFTVYFEGEYVIHSVLHPSKLEKKSNEQP